MYPLVKKCWEEYSMRSETLLMDKDLLKVKIEIEWKLKLLVLFLDNLSMNLCKLDLKLSIVWYLLVEDKENLLLVIDKLVKLP